MSRIAGNCTRCGSPIFGTCPEDVRRTCNCVFPAYTQPYYHPPCYPPPHYPTTWYGKSTSGTQV